MSYLGQQLGQGQAERFVFTASGSETSVTTADDGRAIAYTVGQVDVYLNGAKLINGSDFTATTGTSITGLAALTASDVVEVFALSIFQASDTVSAASGGTFNGNVTVAANLSVTGNAAIAGSQPRLELQESDTTDLDVYLRLNGGDFTIETRTDAGVKVGDRIRAASNGDISFYEDTGSNAKLFWDASAEFLGIGTTSPARELEVTGTGNVYARITATTATDSTALELVNTGETWTITNDDTNSDALEFSTSGGTHAVIDTSGNVGIGTTSIDLTSAGRTVVQVEGSSNALLNLTDGTSRLYLHQKGGTNGADIWNNANSYMRFATNDTEAMRIDSSGNLLVGTTTANDVNNLTLAHLFEGASSTHGSGVVGVYNNTGTANCPALVVLSRDASTDSSNRFIQFYADVTSTGATAMGGIVGNGANNVQFATLSDMREKTNIQSISGSLSKINALNPVEFDWIASGEHVNAGFVAQEVEQVFPEFVIENMASEGQEARKGLTGGMTGGIVAHLVKAIQEQQEIINDLRARMAQLEGA